MLGRNRAHEYVGKGAFLCVTLSPMLQHSSPHQMPLILRQAQTMSDKFRRGSCELSRTVHVKLGSFRSRLDTFGTKLNTYQIKTDVFQIKPAASRRR